MALSPASKEQKACVQAVLDGHNVVVEASAGAGKSTTFYHTARAWLEQHPDAPVLLVCFNAVLRAEALRKVTELQLNVHCFTVHALAAAMYRTRVSDTLSLYHAVHGTTPPVSPAAYSLVLIDEAQDLNEDHMDVLNALQAHGLSLQYMIVGDPRQEIYSHARSRPVTVMADPAAYLHDNGKPWTRLVLNTSYRLTAPVCALLNTCFRDPDTQTAILPGNMYSKHCLPWYIIGDREQLHLFDVLAELLQRYQPGEIMILAPTVALTKHRCQQLAYALHVRLHVPIFSTHKQRSDLTPAMMQGKIFLSTYHQSKGYERPCVLVLGVDEHEWELNKCPMSPKGQPLVHNSLHVALTRAQEQLVIFQHYKCHAYPTVQDGHMPLVHLRVMRASEGQPAPPRSTTGEVADTWLVSFQPRSTLTRLLALLPPIEHATVDTDSPTAALCKVTPDSGEDVMDAYLDAIMGWAERQHSAQPARLERQVRGRVTEAQVPGEFKATLRLVHQSSRLTCSKDWMALSMVYNTMVCHDYPHELYQVRHLNWLGPYEAQFIQNSMAAVLAVLPETGFWHDEATRMLQNRPLRARVPFITYGPEGPEPWQFTLNDSYTEHNLLLAMVHMYVFRAQRAHVYSVTANAKHTISAPPDLNTFLMSLLSVKIGA